jgi:hypothetical protein
MECNRANKVWFGSSLGIKFNSTHTNFIDWIFYCLSTLEEEELCVIASLTCGIWFARNKMVFENHDTEEKDIIDKANSTILDYQTANLNHTSANPTNRTNNKDNNNNDNTSGNTNQHQQRDHQHVNQRWKKPSRRNIKANCDANLRVDGKWGLGAIFRDNEGQILASTTWEMPGFNDPATAEACALYFTTRLAVECCFTRVEFECDSSIVVKGVNEHDASPINFLGNFLQGIWNARQSFSFCSFSHVHRKANKVAHELASLAHNTLDCIWIEETHPTIVPFVLMDSF